MPLLSAHLFVCRYRYANAVLIDGNQTAGHNMGKYGGVDDVCLTDGTGYFVTRGPFQQHCENAINTKTVSFASPSAGIMLLISELQRDVCNEHKATGSSDRSGNRLVAGIGAAVCDDAFCIPHTTVDFRKGEG